MKLAVELFDHGNNSLKLYGMLLRNYRVAKKALLLSDMKENEILKLLGLTEKQMRGIRAYRKLPEERLDTVMSILIEAMNRTKIFFWKREKSVYPDYGKIDYIIIGRNPDRDQ